LSGELICQNFQAAWLTVHGVTGKYSLSDHTQRFPDLCKCVYRMIELGGRQGG
jgi:hypothetical protein